MRCQTITNYSLRTDPSWISLLKTYGLDVDHIFVVESLNNKFFSHAFRIVNPEFNTTPDRIKSSMEVLNNLLQDWDASDPLDFTEFRQSGSTSPKQRAILQMAHGEDR